MVKKLTFDFEKTSLETIYCPEKGSSPIMIIPNPADSYFDVVIDKESSSEAKESIKGESILKMYDKMGTLKYSAQFKDYPHRVSTSKLPEGLYIVQIVNNGNAYVLNVVIEH